MLYSHELRKIEDKLENLERQASGLFNEKEYEKALEIYILLFKGNPKVESYAISCGNCYDAMGDKQQAINFYNQALKINRHSEAAKLNLSTIYYEIGNYKKAENYAREVLQTNPDNLMAWQNLANIAYCLAKYDEALVYYKKMYEIDNNSYVAMVNIANTYYALCKYVMALEYASKSLEQNSESAIAYVIAGNSLKALGKYGKSINKYIQAFELDNTNIDVLNNLSEAYHAVNDWENSLMFAWKYMKRISEPTASVFLNFGYLLYECYSEKSENLAKQYAEKWLKIFPENKIVIHMANAILNGDALQGSENEFIKETFDAFAPDFDATLESLEYQAPALIEEELEKYITPSLFKRYRILDLGCGTGLCGLRLKKYAKFKGLIGVDLSEQMLSKAKGRGIYSELICEDICAYLEASSTFYDIISASDVWTYFGDLTRAFVRVSKSLVPNGLFAFTVSENTENNKDFFMVPSGRFVHNINYIEKLLKSSGLKTLSATRSVLRNEAENPVYGYVIVAQKPDLNKQNHQN